MVVTAYLQQLGYRAVVAKNGKEAVEAANRERFDLILMDVQMPVMDGLEATRTLKEQMSPEDVPLIIALTAGVSQPERELCFSVGMDDFLAKPLQPAELKAALDRWLAFMVQKAERARQRGAG
jgi:CheY-like chemotaxis protein